MLVIIKSPVKPAISKKPGGLILVMKSHRPFRDEKSSPAAVPAPAPPVTSITVENPESITVAKAIATVRRLQDSGALSGPYSLAKSIARPGYEPAPVFQPHEMAMPKPVQGHPIAHIGDLTAHGAEANHHLENAMKEIASTSGGVHVPAPPEKIKGEDGEEIPHPIEHPKWKAQRERALAAPVATHMGPMKKPERIAQKLAEDRKDDPTVGPENVLDVSRATITAAKHQDFHALLPHVRDTMAKHGFSLARVKDKYIKPQEDGVRGVLTNWRHHNGHVVEVQMNDSDLEKVKPQGHALLDDKRVIREGARNAGRTETPEESAKIDHITDRTKEIFNGAWDEQKRKHGQSEPIERAVRFRDAGRSHVAPGRSAVYLKREGRKMSKTGSQRKPEYFMYEAARGEIPAYKSDTGAPFVLRGSEWRPTYDAKFEHESRPISQQEFHAEVARLGAKPPM